MVNRNNIKQRNNFIQGLRSFKDTLPTGVKKIISKKGDVFSKILENWKEIVGDELFNNCFPKSFKNTSTLTKSCLFIMVKRGKEIEIEYSKNKIIKNINNHFNENIVENIKLLSFENEEHEIKKYEKIKDLKDNFFKKINNLKNENIKNSLIRMNKYYKKK